MCHLGKRYKQTGTYGGPAIIIEKHTQIRKQLPKPSLYTQAKSCLTIRIRRRTT
jgi:hypothetical protein